MPTNMELTALTKTSEIEFVTFRVADLLIGVDIHQVEEINRRIEVTPVPQAPPYVRGVINLRGEVVTVVDLRTILGVGKDNLSQQERTVVVNSHGEQIGLLVDSIADVVRASLGEISPPPANVRGVDAKLFQGIVKLKDELLVVLDVEAVLASGSNIQ